MEYINNCGNCYYLLLEIEDDPCAICNDDYSQWIADNTPDEKVNDEC